MSNKTSTQKNKNTLQLITKKVTDNMVWFDLMIGDQPVEVMMKVTDYDNLVKTGFFKKMTFSKGDSPAVTVHSSEVYKLPSLTITEE